MMNTISKILKFSATVLYKLSNKIEPHKTVVVNPTESLKALRFKPWFNDDGDKTHRLQYDLKENSVVFDLGGYEGEWAGQIFCLYNCGIYIFEPYEEYCKNIQHKFLHNSRITIFSYGLSKTSGSAKLALADNSSSIFIESENSVDVKLVCAHEFFNHHSILKIDLMKINIEGGEYDLLDHLIETGDVKMISNIQVQFHDFVPDAESRMNSIQADLCRTHELTYQYEFVWENWKLKTV